MNVGFGRCEIECIHRRAGTVVYFVSILTSRKNETVYIGVTNEAARRLNEHGLANDGSFPGRYGVLRLVYFEIYDRIVEAIAREKQLKNW